MSSLVFYLDYVPLLSRIYKSSVILYLVYDKFRNDSGVVQLTYSDLGQHLGLASSTVLKANTILKELNLIEELEVGQSKHYKLLPIKKLSEELRQEILSKYATEQFDPKQSAIRKKYLEDQIPPDFQQLLNKKTLKKAYKELGSNLTNGKHLCNFFKIDANTFKLLQERDGEGSFRVRLRNLMKEIEAEAPKRKEKDPEASPAQQELTKYLYDKLTEANARPINPNSWWMKNRGIAYNFLKTVSLEEAKSLIDQGFADKWWKDKMTDLSILEKMYMRRRLQVVKLPLGTVSRATPIPESIQKEIANINAYIQVDTYEDAYMLKHSILSGESKKDIREVVDILENHGIVPKGQNNLVFG